MIVEKFEGKMVKVCGHTGFKIVTFRVSLQVDEN